MLKYLFTICLYFCCLVPLGADPLVVAHRGASKLAPENTIPAFLAAWSQGADAIEGDFHLTLDGHIVCIHDVDTARVSGRKLVVKETALKDLRKIDVGEWHGDQWKGAKIPTISEVFATVPVGKKIYIEIKCGPEILPVLLEEIKSSGLTLEQIAVISFNMNVIYQLELKAPKIQTYWLTKLKKNKLNRLEPSSEDAIKILKIIKADGISSFAHGDLKQQYIDRVKSQGFEYHVWTIDVVEKAKRFRDMGVNSITTNVPEMIMKSVAH